MYHSNRLHSTGLSKVKKSTNTTSTVTHKAVARVFHIFMVYTHILVHVRLHKNVYIVVSDLI